DYVTGPERLHAPRSLLCIGLARKEPGLILVHEQQVEERQAPGDVFEPSTAYVPTRVERSSQACFPGTAQGFRSGTVQIRQRKHIRLVVMRNFLEHRPGEFDWIGIDLRARSELLQKQTIAVR